MRLCAAVLGLALALSPGLASAHAILMSSSPASGSTAAPGPVTLELRFNSRIDARRSSLHLLPPGGPEQTLAILPAASEDTLTAKASLAPGPQALRWQVLATDGHVTRGEVKFTVAPAR